MAETFKILGQVACTSAAVRYIPYAVPAATQTTISSFLACNLTAATINFRLSVHAAGATIVNAQYLYYDTIIPAKDTFAGTLGVTLGATDEVRIKVSAATVALNLYGVEKT